MRETIIDQIQPDEDGPVYGRVSNPADITKLQTFLHAHAEILARDFIIGSCAIVAVAGFELVFLGGMQVRVLAPGHILTADGKSYELIGAAYVDLTFSAADPDNPRIDTIIATIEEVDTALELRPFVRLRTQDEYEDGVAAYTPQQFNEPTERHWRAVVSRKAGTPGEAPEPPTLLSNEIPLFSVPVQKGATAILEGDIKNLRRKISSICELEDLLKWWINQQSGQPPQKHRHPASQVDIGPSAAPPWPGQTVQAFIDFFSRFSDEDGNDPLTRPETLTDDGKIGAIPAVDTGTPVVDIPIPKGNLRVAFSDRIVEVTTKSFPEEVNARPVNKSGSAGTETETNSLALSVGIIDSIESDGGGAWAQLGAVMSAARYANFQGTFAAARDGRYIELMGGQPGWTAWETFDTVTETSAPRTFSGDVPVNEIVFVQSLGNGNILFATRLALNSAWEWFRVDAADPDGPTVKYDSDHAPETVGKTYGYGTLIQQNVVYLMLWSSGPRDWIYHVDTDSFEQITTFGQGPDTVNATSMGMCFYKSGQAVIFATDSPLIVVDPTDFTAKTFVFDYPTRSFTRLNIAQPEGQRSKVAMANVLGRAYILTAKNGKIWELTPSLNPRWAAIATALPDRALPGAASLMSGGLPAGDGFFFGGQDPATFVAKNDIWKFGAAGVIDTICGGVPGITLAPGVTQATFKVPNFALDWEVNKVLAHLIGSFPPGSVKLSYSFDNDATRQDVMRDKITDVLSSDDPATRILRITLISSGSQKPCITRLEETFEKTGGPGLSELVIRFDAPLGTNGMYLGRDGLITFSNVIEQTTPDKEIMAKITHNGAGVNPTVREYINRRWVLKKFTGERAAGVTTPFEYDIAVPPRFVDSEAVQGGPTGPLYKIADPAIGFDDEAVAVGGVTANGDNYIVTVGA